MKLRRLISLLLLSVYLFATGGPVVASLACHCVAMHVHAHSCCTHCDHSADLVAAKADISAPCCANHHSTEVKLYTASSSESEKFIKSPVTDLPPQLTADCPCPAHIPVLREKTAERPAPFVPDAAVIAVGFRAPPVLA